MHLLPSCTRYKEHKPTRNSRCWQFSERKNTIHYSKFKNDNNTNHTLSLSNLISKCLLLRNDSSKVVGSSPHSVRLIIVPNAFEQITTVNERDFIGNNVLVPCSRVQENHVSRQRYRLGILRLHFVSSLMSTVVGPSIHVHMLMHIVSIFSFIILNHNT